MQCPESKPCGCFGQAQSSTPSPPPCPNDDCLSLCDIVVLSQDGVGPCGQYGSIDVMDESYNHRIAACDENPLRWSIVEFDGTIVDASITRAGVLTWVTGGYETVGSYSTILLKACCGDLSAYTTVIVGVKDLCQCPECDVCDVCDPCTGECIDSGVELSVGTQNANLNIEVDGN